MKLRYYIIYRVLCSSVVLFGISILAFILVYIIPGDPARLIAGPLAPHEEVAQIRKELGLDRPIYEQYLIYMNKLLHGDLGVSIHTRRPVIEDLKEYFAATIELTTVSMVLALIIGFPLGIISAAKKDKLQDHVSRVFSISGVCMPSFWLGLILQLVFCSVLGIMPAGGRVDYFVLSEHPLKIITGLYIIDSILTGNWPVLVSSIRYIILPATCLAYTSLVVVTRMLRANLLEVLGSEYIKTARAYGFSERKILYKYALRNALIPTITIISLSFAYSLSGAFVVESVFSWPGLGRYAAFSIINSDYPAIMGVVLLVCLIYTIINLIVDISYLFIDPRIKLG
jgi:peptide/nickel transport system permease protein